MFALKPLSHLIPTKRALFAKEGYVGLDLAVDKINLVQLGELEDGSLALKEFCSSPYLSSREAVLSSPKELRAVVRNAFKSHTFSTHKVVSSIPSHDVRIISINYTKSKSADDDSSIINAIHERVEEDLSNFVIDYIPVRSADKDEEQLAIVALAEKEIVLAYLEAFRVAGLQMEALEIRPSAINRFVYSTLEKDNFSNILAINFGEQNSFLTITSGKRLLFDHQIDFGSAKLINEVANTLDIPKDSAIELIGKHGFDESKNENTPRLVFPENVAKTLLDICKSIFDKLVEEVNRALLFSASESHGKSIATVYLLGSFANWKGIDVYIQGKINIPTETIHNPLLRFENPLSINIDSNENVTPEIAIAAGHALRGLI